jgi:hypothetical protein
VEISVEAMSLLVEIMSCQNMRKCFKQLISMNRMTKPSLDKCKKNYTQAVEHHLEIQWVVWVPKSLKCEQQMPAKFNHYWGIQILVMYTNS